MKRKYFTFKPFLDMLFCTLLMLVAILFLLKTSEENTKARPLNVVYEIVLTWDSKSADDLDIYVKTASGHMVWFGSREGGDGSLAALTHDALGRRNNQLYTSEGVVTKFHEEVILYRGITPGEHIVNVHVYAKRDHQPVTCVVRLIKIKPFREVIVKKLTFNALAEETTAFRFVTDNNGKVVDINKLPTILSKPQIQ